MPDTTKANDREPEGVGPKTTSTLWTASLRIFLTSIFLAYAVISISDPDLWGHLLFGQRMLDLGHVTRTDVYSFLSAPEWINHEWLAEVLFASAWELGGGTAGLVIFKGALVLAVLSLIYSYLRRQNLDMVRAGFLVGLLFLPFLTGIRTIRPQLFTFFLFPLTLLVLMRIEAGHPKFAWLLPAIVMVWVNLHGGVLAGLGTIGLWAMGHGVRVLYKERRAAALLAGDRKHAWGGILVCGLALLANPYGPELPAFLLETGTVDRPFITEWQPLDLSSVLGVVYLLFLGIGGAALIRSSRAPRPISIILLPVMALLPFSAVRLLPLFGISIVLLLAPQFSDLLNEPPSRYSKKGPALARGIASILMIVAAGAFLMKVPSAVRCIPVGEDYPVEAVSLLEDSGAGGHLVVNFTWGEYAIWHLHDHFRVSMDGRRETVYPDSIYENHLSFLHGTGDWDRVLDTHPVNVALVPADNAADNLLELKPGWGEAYRDSVAAIHVREGTVHEEKLSAAVVTRHHPARSNSGREEGRKADEKLCFP